MIDKASIMIDNATFIRLETNLLIWNWAVEQTEDKQKIQILRIDQYVEILKPTSVEILDKPLTRKEVLAKEFFKYLTLFSSNEYHFNRCMHFVQQEALSNATTQFNYLTNGNISSNSIEPVVKRKERPKPNNLFNNNIIPSVSLPNERSQKRKKSSRKPKYW